MRRSISMKTDFDEIPEDLFTNVLDLKAYEKFFIVAEQLKYWETEGLTPQDAMEALDIKPTRYTGKGFYRANFMDVGLAMIKHYKWLIK